MLFAFLSGPQFVVLGLLILVIGFVLRRSAMLNRRSQARDPAAEVRSEIHNAERAAGNWIHSLEVRMHDYSREVEGRIETNLTRLDQLIVASDREIERLSQLIEESSGRKPELSQTPDTEKSELSEGQQQRFMIVRLRDSGFEHDEIAGIAKCSVNTVRSVLCETDHQDRDAA
jgi:hypothetical protein